MTRILGILPQQIHHLRTDWNNVSEEDRNVNTLIEHIRLEEERLNTDQQSGYTSQNALQISSKARKDSHSENVVIELF